MEHPNQNGIPTKTKYTHKHAVTIKNTNNENCISQGKR